MTETYDPAIKALAEARIPAAHLDDVGRTSRVTEQAEQLRVRPELRVLAHAIAQGMTLQEQVDALVVSGHATAPAAWQLVVNEPANAKLL